MKVKLRRIRENKGISQREISKLLNISQPQYSRIESGDGDFSQEEWRMIADALGVEEKEIKEDNSLVFNNYHQKGNYFAYSLYISDKLVQYFEERNNELKLENQNLKLNIISLEKSISQFRKRLAKLENDV